MDYIDLVKKRAEGYYADEEVIEYLLNNTDAELIDIPHDSSLYVSKI